MAFRPVFCPYSACPSHSGLPFTWREHGRFVRKCDGRTVPRYFCHACGRRFSRQTFRLDHRLKRPWLLARFFVDRISKVTHRQSARNQHCSRTTEERHFRRLSGHCRDFHGLRRAEVAARGGLGEIFLLDELETYEHHRTKKPVTVPILIERRSGFVLDARVGALPARKKPGARRRSAAQAKVDLATEAPPRRRSESRAQVRAAFLCLREFSPRDRPLIVRTDKKPSYATLLQQLFGERCRHERTAGTRRRDVRNPLWPINHTLARVRDGLSRLVRETWAAAKLRERLAGHLDIWTCYRNYIRGRVNREPRNTPAMALGVQDAQWSISGLLEWRVFPQ